MSDIPTYRLAVKGIITDGGGRVLVLKRSGKSREFPGKWDLPGGKINAGEKIDIALMREIREETCLDVVPGTVIGKSESGTRLHRIIHLFVTIKEWHGDINLSREHDEYRWLDIDSILTLDMVDHFLSVLQSYKSCIRNPETYNKPC